MKPLTLLALILLAMTAAPAIAIQAARNPENPIYKFAQPLLADLEKRILELIVTLDVLFSAGETIAFSQNFTESEEAVGKIKRSVELLETQQAEYLEYLKSLQNKSEKMLSELANTTEVYLTLNEKATFDNLSIVFQNLSLLNGKFEIQLKVFDAADKKIFALKENEIAVFQKYAITYEALFLDEKTKEYVLLLRIRRESL